MNSVPIEARKSRNDFFFTPKNWIAKIWKYYIKTMGYTNGLAALHLHLVFYNCVSRSVKTAYSLQFSPPDCDSEFFLCFFLPDARCPVNTGKLRVKKADGVFCAKSSTDLWATKKKKKKRKNN